MAIPFLSGLEIATGTHNEITFIGTGGAKILAPVEMYLDASNDIYLMSHSSVNLTLGNNTATFAGNVGIKESSIDANLHITDTNPNIKFERSGQGKWAFGMPNNQTYLAFDETSDDLTTPTMVLTKTTKRVGIGVSDPDAKLEVIGSTSNDQSYNLRLRSADDQELLYVRNDGIVKVSHNYLYVDNSAGFYSNGPIRARAGVTDDGGTLGLGGNGSVANLVLTSNTSATFAGSVTVQGGLVYLGTADQSSGHINSKELMTFNIDSDNDDTNRYFAFYKDGESANGTQLLKILETGYVAIGSHTPTLALDVKGGTNLASRFMFTKDLSTDKVLFGGADHDTFGAPFIGSSSNHTFTITQNGGAAITIDTSKNASFVGNITLTPASGHPIITSGASKDLNINAGSGNVYINNNTTFAGDVTIQGDGKEFWLKSADQNLARIIPRGTTGDNIDKGLFSLIASDSGSGQTNIEKVRIDSGGGSWFNGGNVSFGHDVTITGNLTVDGTTTTLNTTTVEVEDNILQLNTTQGSPDTATATTSGISIYRGDGVTQASLIFDDADDTWDLTNNLNVAGNVTVYTGASTGALSVGRNSSERLEIHQGDTNTTVTAYNDVDENQEHNFILDRSFGGSGGNNFLIRKAGVAQLSIDKDAKATFAGQVSVKSDIFLNPDYVNANEYLYLRKHQSGDGGIIFQSKTSGGATQSDFQIRNQGTTGDLKFYAYGLAGEALILDRENGNATFGGNGTFDTILNVIAPDGGGSPAMTSTINMHGYDQRGVGIKMKDNKTTSSGSTDAEWFVGTGYNSTGFNIGYASDGSQSSYPAQRKLSVDTSGNAILVGDLTVNHTSNVASAPLYIGGNVSRGSWNDGLVIDEPSGWAATIYKRSNSPKMFTGLYSGNDNYIWMASPYSNSGTSITAPRTDMVLEARPSTDDLQIYLDTHFGGKIGVGTSSPEFALHLADNVGSGGLNSGVMLEMRSSTITDPAGMRFVSQTGGSTNYMQNLYDGANLKWKHWSGSAYVDKITFSNNGNATFAGNVTASSGTGHFSLVNSSAYQLNGTYVMDSSRNLVNIASITASGHVQQNHGGEIRSKDSGGNVRTVLRATTVSSVDKLQYGWSGNGKVEFMGGGAYSPKITIDTNGKVGIGTARGGTDPDEQLHVAGENNGYDGTLKVGERGIFAHRDAGQTKTFLANNYNHNSSTFGIRMKGVADSNEVMTITGAGATTFTGSVTASSFSGDGSGLTNVSSSFTGGTVANATTFSSDVTINSAGTSGGPCLRINNLNHTTFNHGIEVFNGNLVQGESEIILVGKTGATKNSGYLGYYWHAANSDDNFVTIGHFSNNHLLRVYGSGTVLATGNMQAPIFYDSDNTSYFLNPASNSTVYQLYAGTTSSDQTYNIRLEAANKSSIGFHDSGSTIGAITFSGAEGFRLGANQGSYGPHQVSAMAEFMVSKEVTDASGQAIKGYRLNKATSSSWAEGGTGAQTGWYGGNFGGSEITTKWVDGPHGERTLAAETTGDTGNDYDGGYVKAINNLDINKAHLSIVYIKRISSEGTGNVYHGTGAGANQITNLSGTSNTNPYFHYPSLGSFPQDVWCVSIGVIQANNDDNTTAKTGSGDLQGIYRCDTGQKIMNSSNYWKMGSAGSTLNNGIRFFHYYSTNANAKLQWAKPGFYEINGDEPSLAEILTGGNRGLHTNGGDVTANKFWDWANTAYYLDPADTGVSLNVAGQVAGKSFKAEGNSTDQYFYEGVRTGVGTTLRIYDNSSDIYFDSWDSMTFRANQNGGSGGAIGLTGGNVNIQKDLTVGTGSTHNGALTIRSLDSSSSTRTAKLKFNIAGTDTTGFTLHNNTSGIAANTLIYDVSGTEKVTIYGDGHIRTVNNVTAQMFRDQDNTAYYVNPAGLSQMHTIDFDGAVSGSTTGAAQIGRNHAYDTLELKGYGAELMIGAQHTEININYRTCNNNTSGHTPTTWKWRAGASNNWSNHYFGDVTSNGTLAATGEAHISGKVGINTTDPNGQGYSFAEDLVILGGNSASDGVGITLRGNGKRYGVIAFGDNADDNPGEIFYDHNSDHMYFRTGTSVGLEISNGNVVYVSDMRSTVYYDSNDTAYYLDPASTGTSLNIKGKIQQFCTDGNTFLGINHSGNENWEFKCESASGTDDFISIGASGGDKVKIYEDGKFEHKGLEPTTGTNIDQIKEFTMTFQLSANTWTDTGINATDLTTGTYAVQVYVDDYGVGGNHYTEYYSGMMSWYSTNTNNTSVDELVLHRAGHAPNNGDIQLRTERVLSADSNDLMLQIKHNQSYNAALDNSAGKSMRFKFRRLI